MATSAVATAFSMLGHFLEAATFRSARRKERDALVRTILQAVNHTAAYIADTELRGRDREREHALMELWTAAAVAIRHHDRHFAEQLQHKAEYWCDPTRWTDADVARVGISLVAVRDRARAFLGGEL